MKLGSIIFLALMVTSQMAAAQGAQLYDKHGNPTQCIVPGHNEKVAPEVIDGLCSSTYSHHYDKYQCLTDGGSPLTIHMQHWRITKVTVYTKSGTYHGTSNSAYYGFPDGLSVVKPETPLYGVGTLQFHHMAHESYGVATDEPFDLKVTGYIVGSRAPQTYVVTCEQEY